MLQIPAYVSGRWHQADAAGVELRDAVSGDVLGTVCSDGIDFAAVARYGREIGGPALRSLGFAERAAALKAMARHLSSMKDDFYELSFHTGATRSDSRIDIDGGIGTVFSYASLLGREFPDGTVLLEGDPELLSKRGGFVGRHILSSRPGVALHINAYNFPCWGMLEKIAPSLAAGMPVIIKPATPGAYLAQAVVREIVEGGFFPEGAIQLVCGSVGDLMDHLREQDVVTFTGSASTGARLRSHPNLVARSIPFNMEADSLNCAILGESVSESDPEFALFVDEVVREMTVKAGQKCTAIRRALVPRARLSAVESALRERLGAITVGDPRIEGTQMGPLAGRAQAADVQGRVRTLAQECEIVCGGEQGLELVGDGLDAGAFFPPTLLRCDDPHARRLVHEVEAFGPVSTLVPYDNTGDAVLLAALGKGSLVGSLFTHDESEAREIILATAPYHGRMLVLDRDCAAESTGHGSPLPTLVHGGPGRAGGGEELGGARAIKHYMQRTAIQASPSTLMAITGEYHRGARTVSDAVHPFRKWFDDLQVGETLVTHRRTVTEADIVNFGCVSGDHFYAHFDEIAARDSFFGQRVAHGYFVIAAAAGMFVEPSPGPVIANYGLENLRFVEPVPAGTTIQARITVKRKVAKVPRGDETPNGVVVWAAEVTNQDAKPVALYDIMTLVARKPVQQGAA